MSNIVALKPTPRPPECLSPAAVEIWNATVAAVPPGHFAPADAPLLECYSEAVARCRLATEALAREGHVTREGRRSPWLMVLAAAERTVLQCSRALRLTTASRSDPKTTGRAVRKHTPSAYDLLDDA